MAIAPFHSINLAGLWTAVTEDDEKYSIRLPGSLGDNSIGEPEPVDPPILTRLTRRFEYKGRVRFYKNLSFRETDGKRYFLEVERTRQIRLFIDDVEIKPYTYPTLIAPVSFEVTGFLSGTHQIMLEVSNRYTKHPALVYESNMAAVNTQTNWNGLLGEIRIREEEETFVDKAYLRAQEDKAVLVLEVHRKEQKEAFLHLYSDLFAHSIDERISLSNEITPIILENLELAPDVQYWDEKNPVLYPVSIVLDDQIKKVKLGIRVLSYDAKGSLRVNNQPTFIQGDTNEAVFPDTIYPPFDQSSWERLYKNYQALGINTVYFRSYCPPEAAFQAADEIGIYLMPEISLAEPINHFFDDKVVQYYKLEASRILREYGNHPSFLFLSFGCNHPYEKKELPAEQKKETSNQTIDLNLYDEGSMKKMALEALFRFCEGRDASKLYVINGKVFSSDAAKKTPQFAIHMGQYDFLPELDEADLYDERFIGTNYQYLRHRAVSFGLLQQWPKAARTNFLEIKDNHEKDLDNLLIAREMNGFFLSGLQDMPGFGTHLHGFLNAHLVQKTYTKEFFKEVSGIFQSQKVLVRLEKNILSEKDFLIAQIFFRNETAESREIDFSYRISFGKGELSGNFYQVKLVPHNLSYVGTITKPVKELLEIAEAEEGTSALSGKIQIFYEKVKKETAFYFFQQEKVVCPDTIRVSRDLSLEDLDWLSDGNLLLLMPSCPAVSVDYWNLLVNERHPIFQYMPDGQATLRIFQELMINGPVLLPRPISSIVTGFYGLENKLPSYCCEFRLNGGNVFLSTLPLLDSKAPQAGALLKGIYAYMDSFDFNPKDEFRVSEIRGSLETLKEV